MSGDEPAETGTHEGGPAVSGGTVSYVLQQFPEKLALVKLPVGAEVPSWAESSSLFSVTATATETTLICAGRNVPTKQVAHKGLVAFSVQGPIPTEATGVLAALLVPLAEEQISVFSISTFETDWVLVPSGATERATEAWRRHGHTVRPAVPVGASRAPREREPRAGNGTDKPPRMTGRSRKDPQSDQQPDRRSGSSSKEKRKR
ncbi:ACT domain-containing protein [Nocardioides sp. Leaf285]|uniref:ACT domain-containing protein n=1 Tax=Nocardioides sp. Leaf285 TaxID=1736322 RepID=UPI000703893B|nr:ACT domain-containing protein [Nocardioides sp. Leaf285]KQP67063.1 hypothetical protein ASF47_05200 [Nocardioides sp. Leaf285]